MIEAAAMLGSRPFEVYLRALLGVFSVLSAARRLPLVGRSQDAVLDRLFGPAEEYEYVSTTRPAFPPPTY